MAEAVALALTGLSSLMLGLAMGSREGLQARVDRLLATLPESDPDQPQDAASAARGLPDLTGLGLGASLRDVKLKHRFSLRQLRKATGKWAEERLIGSGAAADVYRGVSARGGEEWAVKRAKQPSRQFEKEVRAMAAVAGTAGVSHHPNLLPLLGFCSVADVFRNCRYEQILVFEFMPNGGLDKWIGEDAPRALSMSERMGILMGAGVGLEYLHSIDMVHGNVKPANILLDATMQAKVAHMATRRVASGSSGYVDPGYVTSQNATPPVDVYSFGVVILEVITGKKAPAEAAVAENGEGKSPSQRCGSPNLQLWVAELLESVDHPSHLIVSMAQLAQSCTGECTAARPTMKQVLAEMQVIKDRHLPAVTN
ncbi:hypothetical protein CLOP_g14577 [Closterium sp. NIES-67]|nr:hypothetical protein CLOP_g14577 [Closterium sp. NIES-67]